MIIVAALVLPAIGLTLFGLDHIETWLYRPPRPRRSRPGHGRRRHLHLVPRGADAATEAGVADRTRTGDHVTAATTATTAPATATGSAATSGPAVEDAPASVDAA